VSEHDDDNPSGAPDVPDRPGGADLLRAAPAVARVAASSLWQLMNWSIEAGVASTGYVVRRTLQGEPPAAILQDAATDLRAAAWRVLGLHDQQDRSGIPQRIAPRSATTAELQRRGSDLMRRANDVRPVEETHPAFARILGEITPDEGRILRFLYLDGAQPAIDVRTNRPLGIGSELVAGGLSMIAEHAGCLHLDRIGPYLTNLERLGLIEFSKEQVSDPKRYQVVEAQPKVVEALRAAGRLPKLVQRSIRLTAFGAEFCRTCLPVGAVRRTSGTARSDDRRP
jgi:hypothetical protein